MLLELAVAKAIQSELVTQRVGDIELLTKLLPEILFPMPREKEWRRPQTKERREPKQLEAAGPRGRTSGAGTAIPRPRPCS
jgi:hypothetical protein